MAWTYNIENVNGTVNLNSAGCTVLDYAARSAKVEDGNETVDEPFRILITGTSRAHVDAIAGTVQRSFRTGERWQDSGAGPRTFFTRSMADDATTKRSELVRADFSVSDPQYVSANVYAGTLGKYSTELSGVLTRRNWWEGADSQLPLTNTNGTLNTSGLNVYDNNSGTGTAPNKRVNWFEITAGSILGDLPAATRIELTLGTLQVPDSFYLLGNDTPSAQGTAGFWNETGNGAGGTLWTSAADTNRSNAAYDTRVGGTAASMFYQGIAFTNYLSNFDSAGNYIFLASMAGTSTVTIKASPELASGVPEIFYGPSKYLTIGTAWSLYDIGIMKFPAVNHPDETKAMNPGIYFEQVNGVTVQVDYFAFIRIDQFRYYYGTGLGIIPTYGFIDDGLDDLGAYNRLSAAGLSRDIQTRGNNLMVIPGRHNRFHFMCKTTTTWSNALISVKVYYRPRYLSL